MQEVLVNSLRGLSLPRKSVVRLTDRPDITLDVYRGRKTTTQQLIGSALACILVLQAASGHICRICIAMYSGIWRPHL